MAAAWPLKGQPQARPALPACLPERLPPVMVSASLPSANATARPLTAVTAFGFIGPFIFLVSPVIAGQLALQWQWPAGDIGLLMAAELAGASLATFPAILLLRRLPWRPLTLGTGLIFILISLATAFVALGSGALGWMLGLSFLGGAAGGVLSVVSVMAASAYVAPHRAFACWAAGQTVSAALGLLLLPLLFNITGLAGLYGVLALMTVLAMATLGGLPDHWQTPPAALSSGRSGAAGLSLLAIFGYFTAVSGAWAFVGVPGAELGLSEPQIGTLTAVAMFTAVVGSAAASMVENGPLRTPSTLSVFVLLLLCLGLIAQTGSLPLYIVAVIAFQLCWSFLVPMLLATLADNDSKGNLMIFSNMIIGGGAALGPLVSGYALEHSGHYADVALLGGLLLLLTAASFLIARIRGRH